MDIKEGLGVELAEYIYDNLIKENGINEIATLKTGVLPGDDVNVFAQGDFTEVSVVSGCKPEYGSANISSGKKWEMGTYGLFKEYCETQLNKELLRNQKLFDLTQNEAFNKYVTEYMLKSFNEALIARTLFQSKTASDYTTAGLTGATNGLLLQGEALIANGDADASQHITIATNTKAALRNGDTMIQVLYDVIDAFSSDLQEDAYIMMNQKAFSDLAYCMRNASTNNTWNESQYSEVKGGYKVYTFDGIKIIVNPQIDKILEKMQSGDKFYGKRAVIFASNVPSIQVATRESENVQFEADVFYDRVDKNVKADFSFNTGAIIALNKNWVSAY